MGNGLTGVSHRLLVSRRRWARLRRLPDVPLLQRMGRLLDRQTAPWLTDRTLTLDETAHNWHLLRARGWQTRVVSLLVQYGRTGDRLYRDAAVACLREMGSWDYWSWIAWRQEQTDPNIIFDLSCGENAATLAFAYDWLAEELTEDERACFLEIARTRALQPYLANNGTPGSEMWYYRSPDSNWNTVCNGGAGLLALALEDALPECARVLALADEGIRYYFEGMGEDGAWPEGIGYWGYGHRYGYLYLLSHQRATGQPHPLLSRPASRATLRFPLLFSPNNAAASFGDVNSFLPLPFIFAAAEQYASHEVIAEVERRLTLLLDADAAALEEAGPWPNAAEALLFHPGEALPAPAEVAWPMVSVQQGLGWGYLADRWPHPRLYVSVRGGTTDAPHTHQDATSLFVVVGNERLIMNVGATDYLDTTFGPRRGELYEHGAASKNVLFVNGVALPHPATVTTQRLSGPGWDGLLLDGTAAAAVGSPVSAYARIVLMLQHAAILIIDRVTMQHAGLAEVRYHTYADVRFAPASADIAGEREALHLAFAASVPARLHRGLGTPTLPAQAPDTMLRWMSEDKHADMLFATLLTPNGSGALTLDAGSRILQATGPDYAATLAYPISGLAVTDADRQESRREDGGSQRERPA